MKRIYDLYIRDRKKQRLVKADSWGVIAGIGDPSEMDAEAMEQFGRRLMGEARAIRRSKEIKAA